MSNWVLKIYDYFRRHRKVFWLSLVGQFVVFFCLIFHLDYSEDISDFLPLESSMQEAFSVYRNISGVDRLYILFDNPGDVDRTVEAIDYFTEAVHRKDTLGWCRDLTARFDMDKILEVMDFVYDNIPYFLTDEDYERMDSLLAIPGYIHKRMEKDREMLMYPSSGFVVSSMSHDPLDLFSPVMGRLRPAVPQMSMEMYDGYIFTPDMSRAVVMLSSPFGNSETEYNSKMVALLKDVSSEMSEQYPDVSAHIVGGPEVAVENASRIKKDSVWAISLSVILIISFVAYTIGSVRNVLLLFLSIGWGWLFALAGMSLFHDSVSIIVIGISSVILGIAVNYPLHLVVHSALVPDMKAALKEVVFPLLIGNITTVGAFMTLVPLQSAALRDLGLFASFLLVGTIFFVLLYLPHAMKKTAGTRGGNKVLDRLAGFSPEKYKSIVVGTIVVTIVLAFFYPQTEFDSNLANTNYMEDEQRKEMQYFQSLLSNGVSRTSQSVYVLSSGTTYDEALAENTLAVSVVDSLVAVGKVLDYSGVSAFLASRHEQQHRLDMWRDFVARHHHELTEEFSDVARRYGFSPGAFSKFMCQVERAWGLEPQDIEYFAPLVSSVFSGNLTQTGGRAYVVNILNVEHDHVDEVKSCFGSSFDVTGMNSAFAEKLSENFNYIGWACSLIVFIFLWFSFGRIELAVISFLPMAVSWIWILGIMAVFGIKFNIVNVILATFIFGQGDDYTIFMTEGCQHEYTYRRPILGSYKSSILQSAFIMFVGIGTLITSKHPALHSLAEVTIIGMFSVVLMSYLIPPLLFKWLTMKNGTTRKHPLTLPFILGRGKNDPVEQVRGRYIYKHKHILRAVTRSLRGFSVPDLEVAGGKEYVYEDLGYGERALLIALTHPSVKVLACIPDEDRRRVAEISAKDFINNIEFKDRL